MIMQGKKNGARNTVYNIHLHSICTLGCKLRNGHEPVGITMITELLVLQESSQYTHPLPSHPTPPRAEEEEKKEEDDAPLVVRVWANQ